MYLPATNLTQPLTMPIASLELALCNTTYAPTLSSPSIETIAFDVVTTFLAALTLLIAYLHFTRHGD